MRESRSCGSFLSLLQVLGFFCFWRRKSPRPAGVPAAVLLCLVFALKPQDGMQMTMLDVGQGDCIYIRTESGKHYLYDAGSSSQKDWAWVIPFLKYQGVGRLEAVFVSHWDADHINGLEAVFEWAEKSGVSIGGLVLPQAHVVQDEPSRLVEMAGSYHIPVYRMEAGISFNGWKRNSVSASGWKGQLYGPEYSLSGCAAHSAGGERG
ncbi:MAG: MBL fold metallo-hydrolase [Victivallales bacterium]